MTVAFLAIILLSVLLALLSRRGHLHQKAEDFFVASGQFSTVLFFFLAVGETYSITTVLGFPGGVYANGTGFITWFLGYILLAFVVGYFLNPLIWRAGRIHGAVTLPDLFRRHFDSRPLEVVVACTALLFLVPLGMQQFLGLQIILRELDWGTSPLMAASVAGLLAFSYIAISGIRASAYIAVLKDILLIIAILLTGLVAMAHWSGGGASASQAVAAWRQAAQPTLKSDVFAITTILLQSVGFCIVPQTCAYIFTARSASSVRRAQVTMPLYMVMFPFLTVIAYFALSHLPHIASANDVFPAVAKTLLPAPFVGVVLAGAALAALVVLTGVCLAIGPLVSRNLVPGLGNNQQRQWSKVVMALYLLLSIGGAATSSQLMVTINNLYYFGMTQFLPGMLGILLLRRLRPSAIIVGILAGDAVAIALYEFALPVGGVNPGFVGLAVNVGIVFATLYLAPGQDRVPIASLPLRAT
ncbi:MAG: sodium:solute symporter [Rhizomicrobium sp.]